MHITCIFVVDMLIHFFFRYTRQISQRLQWKANEWFNWLLYFSTPALMSILPDPYFENFQLLVSTITKLLKNNLNDSILEKCERDLKMFVINFERLYGKKKLVYNVHLLLHLVDSVRHFGPAYGFSLFPYENMNGFIKACIKGPKEPLLQINNKYLIYNKVHNGYFSSVNCRSSVLDICSKMLSATNQFRECKYLCMCIIYIHYSVPPRPPLDIN